MQEENMATSSPEKQQRVIGDYIVTEQIGSGSFAVVWKGRHKVTGMEVAIKEIPTGKLNRKLQESLESEIAILKRANHPNIIRLLEIVKSRDRIFLFLEYCAGGDLSAYIRRTKRVKESTAQHFMRQLGAGLQVLRANNLIHRDLKPQNLLLSTKDRSAVLKIADFGFARSLQPQGLAETLCGSPLYMAPEILQFQKYDAKADLWSVGAILFELLTGRPPFVGANHIQLLRNIEKTEARIPPAIAAELSESSISMCRSLLRRNPVERLSFEEFFHHPFLDLQRVQPQGGYRSEDEMAALAAAAASHSPRTPSDKCLGPQVPNPPTSPNHNLPFALEEKRGSGDRSCDSFECIEKEYVVVEPPLRMSAEAMARSQQVAPPRLGWGRSQTVPTHVAMTRAPAHAHTPAGASAVVPSRIPSLPVQPAAPICHDSIGSQDGGEVIDGPSPHAPTRLASLQRTARIVSAIAADKLEAGESLDALSLQLLGLGIWREALGICHSWAAMAAEGEVSFSPQPQDLPGGHTAMSVSLGSGGEKESEGLSQEEAAAKACATTEREFLAAVEKAEEAGRHVSTAETSQMPDALELVYESALAVGRSSAVEELMGNVPNAAVGYAKASALFFFLLVEAPALPLNPPFVLSPTDRARLHRYAESVILRQNQCTSQRAMGH